MQATFALVLITGVFLIVARLSPARAFRLIAWEFVLCWIATTAIGYWVVASGVYARLSGGQDSMWVRGAVESGFIVALIVLMALIAGSLTRLGAMYFPVRMTALFWIAIAGRAVTVFFPINPGPMLKADFDIWQTEVLHVRKLSDMLFGFGLLLFLSLTLRSVMQRLGDHLRSQPVRCQPRCCKPA